MVTGMASFAGAVAAQTTPLPDASRLTPGDTLEWRQVDNRTKLEESRITRTIVETNGVREVVYSDGLRRPVAFIFVGEPSAKPWRIWPLEVGKAWSHDTNWSRGDGVTGNTKQDARVVAYEEVVVPAGKFMAYRIEYDGWVTTSQGFRGRIADVYWFAPDALADVKHSRIVGNANFTRELVQVKTAKPAQ